MGNYSLIEELGKYLTERFPACKIPIPNRPVRDMRHRFQLRKSSKPRIYVNVIFGNDFLQEYALEKKQAKAISFLDHHQLPQNIQENSADNTLVTIVVNLLGVCLYQPRKRSR